MSSQIKGLNVFFQKVYFWMFLGLLLSAVAALSVMFSPTILRLIVGTPLFFVLIIGELGLVLIISMFLKKISAMAARMLFVLYSILTGLTLSVVLLVYTSESVIATLLLVAIMFILLSLYGFFTKRDLSRIGPILFIALIALIIAMIVNMFLHSSAMGFAISIIGVVIFTGLIIYDTQSMKKFYALGSRNKEMLSKFVILGALKLYLDFINLFLFLLRLLGRRRN